MTSPDLLTPFFAGLPESSKPFYNSARLWLTQVGILKPEHMDGRQGKTKNPKVSRLLNRILGLSLEQQAIIFACVPVLCICIIPVSVYRG